VTLREVLEGKHLFFQILSDALSQRYRDAVTNVEKKLEEARRRRREIRENQELWETTMGDAYQLGGKRGTCTYAGLPELQAMLDRSAVNENITAQELKPIVDAMTRALQENSPILPTDGSTNLDSDHGALRRLIEYAANKWEAQYVAYLNKYQFDYAGNNVAPTRMGIISNSASYYAASRYSMNLEVFWSRLQKVLQGDSNFSSVLQDAKMQLDFLVALVWLTLAFSLIWVVLLPYLEEAKPLFLGIAIVGPVLTYMWYLLAIQNYRSYSDLLRASIDLYRLDLLKTLHIPLPANAEQERLVWETLERRFGYGEHPNIAFQNTSP
jgi:hypothetical protein